MISQVGVLLSRGIPSVIPPILTPTDPAPHAPDKHQQASKDMFKKFVHFPFVLSA